MLVIEGALVWPLLPADAPNGARPEDWAAASAAAIEWLWMHTARVYGTRTALYRPQALQVSHGYPAALNYLQGLYGSLWGWGWPFQGDPRYPDGAYPPVLELPGPASAVTEVQTVDGAGVVTVVSPALYRLEGNYLVRTDGQGWPTTQDLTANDGQANTWHVSYTRGQTPPTSGQVAAAALAREWLKLITGDKSCKLPYNTTASSRGGVSVQRDITKALTTTGIELVDRWVTSVNPQGLQSPPAVWTPDLPRGQRPYAGSTLPYPA